MVGPSCLCGRGTHFRSPERSRWRDCRPEGAPALGGLLLWGAPPKIVKKSTISFLWPGVPGRRPPAHTQEFCPRHLKRALKGDPGGRAHPPQRHSLLRPSQTRRLGKPIRRTGNGSPSKGSSLSAPSSRVFPFLKAPAGQGPASAADPGTLHARHGAGETGRLRRSCPARVQHQDGGQHRAVAASAGVAASRAQGQRRGESNKGPGGETPGREDAGPPDLGSGARGSRRPLSQPLSRADAGPPPPPTARRGPRPLTWCRGAAAHRGAGAGPAAGRARPWPRRARDGVRANLARGGRTGGTGGRELSERGAGARGRTERGDRPEPAPARRSTQPGPARRSPPRSPPPASPFPVPSALPSSPPPAQPRPLPPGPGSGSPGPLPSRAADGTLRVSSWEGTVAQAPRGHRGPRARQNLVPRRFVGGRRSAWPVPAAPAGGGEGASPCSCQERDLHQRLLPKPSCLRQSQGEATLGASPGPWGPSTGAGTGKAGGGCAAGRSSDSPHLSGPQARPPHP